MELIIDPDNILIDNIKLEKKIKNLLFRSLTGKFSCLEEKTDLKKDLNSFLLVNKTLLDNIHGKSYRHIYDTFVMFLNKIAPQKKIDILENKQYLSILKNTFDYYIMEQMKFMFKYPSSQLERLINKATSVYLLTDSSEENWVLEETKIDTISDKFDPYVIENYNFIPNLYTSSSLDLCRLIDCSFDIKSDEVYFITEKKINDFLLFPGFDLYVEGKII